MLNGSGINLFIMKILKIIKVDVYFYAQFLCFELHDADDVIYWVEHIEFFEEFSKLPWTQLSIIKHIINQII